MCRYIIVTLKFVVFHSIIFVTREQIMRGNPLPKLTIFDIRHDNGKILSKLFGIHAAFLIEIDDILIY